MRPEWNEDQEKAVRDVIEWLSIRNKAWSVKNEEYRHLTGSLISSLEADIDHSALLGRIIAGKKILDKAPPRCYSYPWYSLGEGDRCSVGKREIAFDSKFLAGIFTDRAKSVVICQDPGWERVGAWTGSGGMLRYVLTGDLYRFDIDETDTRAGWLQLFTPKLTDKLTDMEIDFAKIHDHALSPDEIIQNLL